jgi:glucose 1-dehydrogenase
VNNIGPGALLSATPLNRWKKPEEIAGLAAYLACDEAAFVTGSAFFFIDGGRLRQSVQLLIISPN